MIITRSGWSARQPTGRIVPMTRHEGFVLHHTGTPAPAPAFGSDVAMLAMQRYHMEKRGWVDIGYNYVVFRGGGVYEGRASSKGKPPRGAHCPGLNSTHFGIALAGNFEEERPSDSQIRSLGWLCRNLIVRYDMHETWSLELHREHRATLCPGNKLASMIGQLEQWIIPGPVVVDVDAPGEQGKGFIGEPAP